MRSARRPRRRCTASSCRPASTPVGGGAANIVSVAQAELGEVEGIVRGQPVQQRGRDVPSTSQYAWCATFVSWVLKQTGASSYRNTYVGNFVKQARAGNYNLP